MIEANRVDELDCGNLFDQIDDLLEFPNAEIENGLVGNGVSSLWSDPGSSLNTTEPPGSKSDPFFPQSPSNLSTQLLIPYEDIVQLEWLSTFVEDSFSSGGLALDKSQSSSSTKDSSPYQFQTSSPVSVLENSSTDSNAKSIPISHEKRVRTKRPRPTTFTPRLSIIPPTSISETEPQKKNKKIKILPQLDFSVANQNQNKNQNEHPNASAQGVRKCMHCEITKTPQWRRGPTGPKSLCNACGVRYKSGRLFPEYRPAASPTFVPTLHSNSHRKVIEMRSKNETSTFILPLRSCLYTADKSTSKQNKSSSHPTS